VSIDYPNIRLIAKTMKDKNLSGKCITFGVQGIQGQYDDVKDILAQEGYNYRELTSDEILNDEITYFGNSLHQNSFFKMIGFSSVESLDYFPYEKPTYVLDLSKPIPPEMHERYDLVYDGGTTEHCFDIKQVFSNVVNLLKPNGRVIHTLPISGWLNHGLYQFSPEILSGFYEANGFNQITAIIIIRGIRKAYGIIYDPKYIKTLNHLRKKISIFFTAKKNDHVSNIAYHVQSQLAEIIRDKSEAKPSIINRIKNKILQSRRHNLLAMILFKISWQCYFNIQRISIYRNRIIL